MYPSYCQEEASGLPSGQVHRLLHDPCSTWHLSKHCDVSFSSVLWWRKERWQTCRWHQLVCLTQCCMHQSVFPSPHSREEYHQTPHLCNLVAFLRVTHTDCSETIWHRIALLLSGRHAPSLGVSETADPLEDRRRPFELLHRDLRCAEILSKFWQAMSKSHQWHGHLQILDWCLNYCINFTWISLDITHSWTTRVFLQRIPFRVEFSKPFCKSARPQLSKLLVSLHLPQCFWCR